jgi:hypothetical protein
LLIAITGSPPEPNTFLSNDRIIVSGWTMVMAANTDGNRRYSHTKSNGHRELRLWDQPSTQDVHLTPQQDDLGFQPRSRLERRDQDVQEQAQERDHGGSAYLIPLLTPAWMEFSVRTGDRAPRLRSHCARAYVGKARGAANFDRMHRSRSADQHEAATITGGFGTVEIGLSTSTPSP